MEITLVLPDTNILILGLGGQEPYGSYVKELIISKRLVLSAIVIAEFLVGANEEEERIVLSHLSHFEVLVVDLAVARLGAWYRKKYLKLGKKLPLPDCLIAATARINGVVLATLDKRGYPMDDIKLIDTF